MSDKPATSYVGKYLFFYTPLFPKEPQFISLIPAKVTAAKAERQMFIEAVNPGDSLGKNFTRVGDHIAKVLDTKEDCETFLAKLQQYRTQLSAMNQELMSFQPTRAQSRVRTVAAP